MLLCPVFVDLFPAHSCLLFLNYEERLNFPAIGHYCPPKLNRMSRLHERFDVTFFNYLVYCPNRHSKSDFILSIVSLDSHDYCIILFVFHGTVLISFDCVKSWFIIALIQHIRSDTVDGLSGHPTDLSRLLIIRLDKEPCPPASCVDIGLEFSGANPACLPLIIVPCRKQR